MKRQCVECRKIFEGKPIDMMCPECLKKYEEECSHPAAELYGLPAELPKEDINHPERYGGDTTYECVKVLKAWCSEEEYRGFLKCNAIKYLCRLGKKDEAIKELKKSKWYIEKLIESYEEQK